MRDSMLDDAPPPPENVFLFGPSQPEVQSSYEDLLYLIAAAVCCVSRLQASTPRSYYHDGQSVLVTLWYKASIRLSFARWALHCRMEISTNMNEYTAPFWLLLWTGGIVHTDDATRLYHNSIVITCHGPQ